MNVVSKKYSDPIWRGSDKKAVLVTIITETEDGNILVQDASVSKDESNPDWQAIVKEYEETGIDNNTKAVVALNKENIIAKTAVRKEEQIASIERVKQEKLFETKLAIFEIADIKSSKDRKIKSLIRKAPTEIEAMAYATALLLNVINETPKQKK
jgi:hypothetical protein|tara:strand:+ start:7023 stop:7487 length:465 start_codon:yes stop_codon:yes gene_type:complete